MRASLAGVLFGAGRVLLVGIMLGITVTSAAHAHEGPPFPILMDQPVAGYVLSIWADPDVGEANFYIVIESPEGAPPPETPVISMSVEPISGRLDRTTYKAVRQALKNRMQFEVQPYFDQCDTWRVALRVTRPSGSSEESLMQVESTPPGWGPWDFVIYLFPFLLIGGMWVMAMVRRRRIEWQFQA